MKEIEKNQTSMSVKKNGPSKDRILAAVTIAGIIGAMTMFSSFSKPPKEPAVITGRVVYYGNDPVTYPCIRTAEGKTYGIVCDDNLKEEIKAKGLSTMEFNGKILTANPDEALYQGGEDGYFEVKKFSVIGE